MKKRLSLFCITLALLAATVADAQMGQTFTDQYAAPAFQSVSGDLINPRGAAGAGWPGRIWFETNFADQGLGYNGTYLTLGMKTRLFEDGLDGRWVFESELHQSLEENGGFFSNIGLERIFSISSAQADVSLGVWYDYDGDEQSDFFGHTFSQVGASAKIKTPNWDLLGNGYFPVGIQDYAYGDITGANCFADHNIVIIPGIDSALEGFDVTLRTRPSQLAMVNGTIDFGAYSYSSELVRSFGGGRVRVGFQFLRGGIVSAEINQDDRFNTTGVVSLGWIFGANASGHGHEYSPIGRDLEQTVRNDHIVRFNQEVVLAVDPDTGLPYNVVHVNNTADPMFADGSAERPYRTLVTAQTLSAPGDVIAVNGGDGTDRDMDQGIVLKDDQKLWGTGSNFLIPIQNGQFFQLCSDGPTPTISNNGGFAVVTLADNNDVAGINIEANNADFGIWGNGNEGFIRSNTVSNARFDGVRLSGITGDWRILSNTFRGNDRAGLSIQNALDPTGALSIERNTATGNLSDGMLIRNYDPASTMVLNNTTNNNLRNGLFMENYVNSTGAGVTVKGHTSIANAERGIFMNFGSGNLDILDSTVINNSQDGIMVRNWRNTLAGTDRVLIGTMPGGTSTIVGNGALANVALMLDDPGAFSRVMVTNSTLNGGVSGLAARVEGVFGAATQTRMDIDILNNLAINNNVNDGIRLSAFDSGLINARIGSTNAAGLTPIIGNASGGGNGIALFAEGLNGQPAAQINAVIDNVNISNQISRIIRPGLPDLIISTNGVNVSSLNNALVDITVTDSIIGDANPADNFDTQNGIFVFLDNSGSRLINTFDLDNLTLFSDLGVTLLSNPGTFADLRLANSLILPNGIQSIGGRSDNTPFGDGVGSYGVFVSTIGLGMAVPGGFNVSLPNQTIQDLQPFSFPFASAPIFPEIITDGVFDNLTRVELVENEIRDFTFNGVDVETGGDAQLLLTMTGNNILNNGAGFNDDTNGNMVFGESPGDGAGIADPNNLGFFDGVNIDAHDQSTISTVITGNVFRDNFERGLSLNTFNTATINAVVNNNVFFGNDRGEDADATNPPIGVGTAAGFTGPISTSGFADFEAINNEEFYFRNYEFLVFFNAAGTPVDLAGGALPANTFGFFFPGNVGVDVFGNPVALGTAQLNLSMSSNSFQLGVDLQDFSVAPGDFTLGLDGATNGFTGPFFGITSVSDILAKNSVAAEESFFAAPPNNFPPN